MNLGTILELVFAATGLVLVAFAILTMRSTSHPRATRLISGTFWLLLGIVFIFGALLPHLVTGLIVVALVVLDATGQVGRATDPPRIDGALGLGSRAFVPVLAIPAVTVLVVVACRLAGLDVSKGTLIGLGVGGLVAMFLALYLTRASVLLLMREGRRLNECMGAVIVLPQLLASLGVLFAAAGVGDVIATGIRSIVRPDSLFLLVLANCIGMTLFTIVMGNSFAAFPVIAAGVLVPLIVKPFGVSPELAAIVTLTAGSSGTLITPMAANFNIVPAALLEMKSPYGVMKFQLPFAIAIWCAHVVVLWTAARWL